MSTIGNDDHMFAADNKNDELYTIIVTYNVSFSILSKD